MSQSMLSFAQPTHSAMRLRHYQRDALAATQEDLLTQPNTLVVMATGLGKTQVFVQLAIDWTQGDVLVLCHRDELIQQAQKRFMLAGVSASIEKAERYADPSTKVVIASVQTLANEDRLSQFRKDRFGLVICDEVHHFVANTFVRPLSYFDASKQVGFTATPDRGDKRALGKQWGSVAYKRDILDGIDDGYLVPVDCFTVEVDEIDLRAVKKTKGDLAQGALDEAMLKAVGPICETVVEKYPERKAIAFFPGVHSAALACERFNHLRPGTAALITGATPTEERREIVRGCHDGRFSVLCGCGVPTEGFDWPECDLIVMGRPTLSRALFTQMVGRGTRPLPNTVDFVDGPDGADQRREAIQRSGKPGVLVLNFVGERGKHKLITPLDILGGRFTDTELKKAKAKAKRSKKPRSIVELIRSARSELQNLSTTKLGVKTTLEKFDPFAVLGIEKARRSAEYQDWSRGSEPIMPGQLSFLEGQLCGKNGWKPEEVAGLSKRAASKLITEMIARRKNGRASFKQLAILQDFGWSDTSLSFEAARSGIDYIASQHWSKKRVDMDLLCRAITGNMPYTPKGWKPSPPPEHLRQPMPTDTTPKRVDLLEFL